MLRWREVAMEIKSLFKKRGLTIMFLAIGTVVNAAWAQTESVNYNFCTQSNCADGTSPSSGLGRAETENVLYDFCVENGCADGKNPEAGVIFDPSGNLYGTTTTGGIHARGVVFKLTAEDAESVYSFRGRPDGGFPNASLVFDQNGNLYGTTVSGGAYNRGVVFRLTPTGQETILYNFCPPHHCEGRSPYAGLVFDGPGNLYGTTAFGGAYGGGVVFKLTLGGEYTVVHNFCQQSECDDGEVPYAGLVFDEQGNLYGTTSAGGAYHFGTVFKIFPNGRERVLYSFCALSACADGGTPFLSGVILDRQGNVYGTAGLGGVNGNGVVFKITPQGQETVLYSFCSESGCTDGSDPSAGLVFDRVGNLYGTTESGGINNNGVVFRLSPDGKEKSYAFDGTNGGNPWGGVVFDQNGNLYGTTEGGGTNGSGVVFNLTR
jgi:uncharacterized repeat protein (TIGR03803 family)